MPPELIVFFTVVAFSFSCLVALVLFFLSFNKDEDDGGRFIILFGATVLLFAFVFYSNIISPRHIPNFISSSPFFKTRQICPGSDRYPPP